MKDKKGFTLVELLAVVVIMGIILGISLPAVTAIQKRLVKQRVNTFYRIVEEAADAYVEQYHADFETTSDCYVFTYSDLIDEGLLKESDITCLSEAYGENKGVVAATKVSGNTYTYDYYLTCYDKATSKKLESSKQIPAHCIGVSGGFPITANVIHVKKDGSEEPYVCTDPSTGCWVSGSIRVELNSTSPYYVDIGKYQYFIENESGFTWSDVTPVGSNIMSFTTSNDSNPSTSSYNKAIKFRSVDAASNISSEFPWVYAQVDNTVPTTNISVSSNWENEVTLTFTSNDVPSGLPTYYIDTNGDNNPDITVPKGAQTYTINTNFNGNVKAYAVSPTGITGGWSMPVQVKVDATAPRCPSEYVTGNGNWTSNAVTIKGTCQDTGGSGCRSDSLTVQRTIDTNTNGYISPGRVCDNAGNCVDCDTKAVHIDKEPPTCTSTGGGTWTNGTVTLTGICNDTGGSGCVQNATRQYSGDQNTPNQSPGQVRDNAGHIVDCPANQTVLIDTTVPTVSAISVTSRTGDLPTISATCSDNISPVNSNSATTSCTKSGSTATCTATCTNAVNLSNTNSVTLTWSASGSVCGWNSCTEYYDCNNCSCGNNCACGTRNCRGSCRTTTYYRSCTNAGHQYTTVSSTSGYPSCPSGYGIIDRSWTECTAYNWYDCNNCSCGYSCSCGSSSCSRTNNTCSQKTCWH